MCNKTTFVLLSVRLLCQTMAHTIQCSSSYSQCSTRSAAQLTLPFFLLHPLLSLSLLHTRCSSLFNC